jgi:hypothetical protein
MSKPSILSSAVYDPVLSLARLIEDLAVRVAQWGLDSPTQEQRGELLCAATHIRVAAKHFLKANGRKAPEEPS